MRRNFETLDVDKIQDRWCCGDEPWLFRERWEKLFEDFCDVEQKKFDPSRVSRYLIFANNYLLTLRCFRSLSCMTRSSTARCTIEHSCSPSSASMGIPTAMALTTGGSTNCMAAPKLCLTSSLPRSTVSNPMRSTPYPCSRTFTYTYRREEIGVLTSLPLLKNVVTDLEAARNNGESSLTLYFTKESHIHTLVNLVLFSGLPIANRRIPELDYAVSFSPSFGEIVSSNTPP